MKCMMALVGLFFAVNGYAQSSEPIIIYDPVVQKNFDHPAKPVITSSVMLYTQTSIPYQPIVQNSNYSIQSHTTINPDLKFNNETLDQDILVVIDNKI